MARQRLTNQQRLIRIAGIFIMLGLFLKALSMPSEPVHVDTNFYLNIGTNFINHGELTPHMWRLSADTNIIAGSGSGYGVLLLTYWLKIFGVSLYSGYSLMYIVGVISLVVLFFLARMWWQSWVAALVAVVFTTLSSIFMVQFYVRMDAPAVLSYLLVLWLHIWAVRSQRRWAHFGVGVSVILATEVHIQALLYVGALSFYYLLEYVRQARQKRQLLLLSPSTYFFCGALLAGIIYLIVHVLPDTEAYFIIARTCDSCNPPGVLKELLRYIMFIQRRTTDIFIFIIALGFIIVNRSEADKHYLTILLGYILAQAFVSPPTDIHYATHLLPLIGLGVGRAFAKANEPGNQISPQQLMAGSMIAGFMFFAQFIIVAINMNTPVPIEDDVAYIREYVPHETVVMAPPMLYHHLLEYDNFLSYNPFLLDVEDIDLQTFLQREQPEVYVGKPGTADAEWLTYMIEHDFKQVRETIWISGDLWSTLTVGYSAPIIDFTSTATQLEMGECTEINWQVTSADTVNLNANPVEANGSQEICPFSTTVVTLSAFWVGGIETKTIIVEVD